MIKMSEYYGRSGNMLLMEVGISILSKRFDLYVDGGFVNAHMFSALGFEPYMSGSRKFDNMVEYSDPDLKRLMKLDGIDHGISFKGGFQVKDFVIKNRDEIRNHFMLEYDDSKKEDLFVHVRYDDAAHVNPGKEYYIRAIDRCRFKKGYISSDSFNCEIVGDLVSRYGLEAVNMDPVGTINFAKDCGSLVLSKGTFSWWMGILSNSKNIYYPVGDPAWHGDIYVFRDWKKIRI